MTSTAGLGRKKLRGLSSEPRGDVVDMAPAVHGSVNLQELNDLGMRPCDVLDFSANINPYGPSPAVYKAALNCAIDQYPDRDCLELKAVLAGFLGVTAKHILPGNGAAELIWLSALAFVRRGRRVLVLGPTFSEYARAATHMGGQLTTWRAREETGFAFDLEEIGAHLKTLQPQVVYLCNPNNPTGAILPSDAIANWARQFSQTQFVVDEAYLPFAPRLASALAFAADNILVLRSMTKDFGLAGLRLGYAVGNPRAIGLLREVQPPWSVNAVAQAAGVAAVRDLAHCQCSLERLVRSKQELATALAQLGLMPVPSATHFFVVRVGDGAGFRAALLRRGVVVRDCASFGLPAHVRIAARGPEDNQRLLALVREGA